MSQLHIDDINISYHGQDLSQFGLFPLIAWYLIDVLKLPEYFRQVTVNQKRNLNQKRKPKERVFSDAEMCLGLLALPILGISRIGQMTELRGTKQSSNESEIAKLLSFLRKVGDLTSFLCSIHRS